MKLAKFPKGVTRHELKGVELKRVCKKERN
jgi:hypothetical protein